MVRGISAKLNLFFGVPKINVGLPAAAAVPSAQPFPHRADELAVSRCR
jgi:hypothetical protein